MSDIIPEVIPDTLFTMELRREEILQLFQQEPLTKEQAESLISELAEIETALTPQWEAMQDISDARLCMRFETAL